MMKVFGPAVGELMATLTAQGVEPVGAVFAHHLKMSPDTFDFELERIPFILKHIRRERSSSRIRLGRGAARRSRFAGAGFAGSARRLCADTP